MFLKLRSSTIMVIRIKLRIFKTDSISNRSVEALDDYRSPPGGSIFFYELIATYSLGKNAGGK